MKVHDTEIAGVKIVEPDVFKDARGYFCETYNAGRYKAAGITADFVQDNESRSKRGVLRGLHFQKKPYAQAKLVRVVQGKVLDHAHPECTRQHSAKLQQQQASILTWLKLQTSVNNAHGCIRI